MMHHLAYGDDSIRQGFKKEQKEHPAKNNGSDHSKSAEKVKKTACFLCIFSD